MPELDFMFLADYVRNQGNKLDALGASLDTVNVPMVPTAAPLGIGVRLLLTRQECGRTHEIEIIIQDADGTRVAELRSTFNVPLEAVDPALPVHFPLGALIALNVPIPLPHEGIYSLDLMVNNDAKKSVPLRVLVNPGLQLPAPQA